MRLLKRFVPSHALYLHNNVHSDPSQSLDIDYTVGLATDVPVQFISVGNFRYDGLLDLTNHLLAQDRPPLVLTTSYGVAEGVFNQFPEMAQCAPSPPACAPVSQTLTNHTA